MADTFQLSGSYCVQPASGFPSGDPAIEAALSESLVLKNKQSLSVTLDDDPVESVAFGDMTNAHVIVIRLQGGKAKARFTSADGSTQAIPVDPFLTVISSSVPFTALDLQRVSGSTTVYARIFLGEKA